MASFQAKIGLKGPRMRENKNYRSVPFRPDAKLKIPKNSNKIEKIKIYHYGFISSQNRMENAEKEKKIKIVGPFRSYTTHNRKFQENCKKVQKIKKYHDGFLFKSKLVGKGREGEKIKIIGPFCSYTTRNRKFQ